MLKFIPIIKVIKKRNKQKTKNYKRMDTSIILLVIWICFDVCTLVLEKHLDY